MPTEAREYPLLTERDKSVLVQYIRRMHEVAFERLLRADEAAGILASGRLPSAACTVDPILVTRIVEGWGKKEGASAQPLHCRYVSIKSEGLDYEAFVVYASTNGYQGFTLVFADGVCTRTSPWGQVEWSFAERKWLAVP